jgi:hypothetical protein
MSWRGLSGLITRASERTPSCADREILDGRLGTVISARVVTCRYNRTKSISFGSTYNELGGSDA